MATLRVGPGSGTLKINTYREGVAQKLGHDLVLEVQRWNATVGIDPDGGVESVELNADPSSLQVNDANNGAKALSEKDRDDIHKSIDDKILRGKPIAFASTAVEPRDGGLTVRGDLTMADTTRRAAFHIEAGDDGRVAGTLSVSQSEWGIKPFKALMGALKVRDSVEIVVDARLPAS